MTYNTNITVGAPPLLWSEVSDALAKVNANFQILQAALGAEGITPIDFSVLGSDVVPTTANTYYLGKSNYEWKAIHSSGWEADGPDSANGVWVGSAQIKGIGAHVDIPLGSTLGGSLIIDPDKTFFKTIDVDNNNSIVATGFGDTVKFLSGSGVSMTVDSSAESLTFNNTGILSVADGSGISHSTVSGVATITNTGVRSFTNVASLPSGRTQGAGINISGSTGDGIKITNTGVISISSGVGITVSADAATGDVTITNSAPAVNSFAQIQVDGDTANRLQADAASDVLNINGGEGISLTKNTSTDTLTITVNPVFDLKGSVFGDDSTKIVDAVENKVYGGIFATTLRTSEFEIALGQNAGGDGLQGSESIAIGMSAGAYTQGNYAVAIGSGAGNIGQGDRAIAIGATAGVDQGDYAISIGNGAGYPTAVAQSIAINASGFPLDAPAAGFYVNPIRASTTSARPIVYDTTTKELKYTSTLEFVNSTISTSDSSGIIVDVITTFNTDIIVENDLNVTQRILLQGSRVINISELKSLVAASTDFANFQARIAALV